MGPLQRTPGTASTAFSQDPPWLQRRERISLVKNRMREICTSGSVRDGALGGRLIASSGFKSAYVGGFFPGGSRCTAEPLLTLDEQVRVAGDVARAVKIP